MLVLGIETSCDETGVALCDSRSGLLANLLHSQADLHAAYGGVVPELASRDHVRKITPLVREALGQAGAQLSDLDGVAYAAGPGLMGALLVGAAYGRSLAWSLGRPAIGVHHMEAHLLAPLMEADQPPLPFVALLVSGGHTQLVKVAGIGDYEMLGESLDDAVGEAFDKVGKMLGLGYPGGPAVAACAEDGDVERFRFPAADDRPPRLGLQLQRPEDLHLEHRERAPTPDQPGSGRHRPGLRGGGGGHLADQVPTGVGGL